MLKLPMVVSAAGIMNWNKLLLHLLLLPNLRLFFAESVGSCTDLVATVVKPFALRNHGVRIVISVFADAYLMHSLMKGTSCFIEEAVQYIYKKQLEEADIIVINKTDLLTEDELQYVKEIIAGSYTGKIILYQDAYNENDIHNWIELLNEFTIPIHRNSLNWIMINMAKAKRCLPGLIRKSPYIRVSLLLKKQPCC